MKKLLILVIAFLLFSSTAHAALITIGTADYDRNSDGTADIFDLNLIWDDDNNGNSVVWLDYTNSVTDWTTQDTWASTLDGALTYSIDPGYAVTWNDVDWRLPTTVDGTYVSGRDGNTTGGYNITTSEMGHLFHTELGNLGYLDTSGSYVGNGNWGLNNTGDFENLVSTVHWSGTEYSANPDLAWTFSFGYGLQNSYNKDGGSYDGLAVRSGDVAAAVPEPATIALLGIGLVGIAGVEVRRRRKKTKQQ